jgi:5-oxoprolinase (ATP-hydrolysing) subunit A
MKIDINCDMGESFGRYTLGNDGALIQTITSANVACGLHAGDPQVMDKTVQLAIKNGVAIGAHPGYPDFQGFGRRTMDLSLEEIEAFMLYQIGALSGFVRSFGAEIVHVKPHGAIYNQAAKDRESAQAIARAVKRFSPSLILVGLAGSLLVEMGFEAGLRTANEGFPERGYNPDGTLMSRKLPGAIIDSPEKAAAQALSLVQDGIKVTLGGKNSIIQVDTLCIHGDSPNALAVSKAVCQTLRDNGIEMKAL